MGFSQFLSEYYKVNKYSLIKVVECVSSFSKPLKGFAKRISANVGYVMLMTPNKSETAVVRGCLIPVIG